MITSTAPWDYQKSRPSRKQVELDHYFLKGYISWQEYQYLNGQWTFRKFLKSLGFTFKRVRK